MFAKGTKIMYGNTGVCEVMDYATPDLPGMPRGTKYYVLRPLFQSGTIYCPVEQPKVFMRPVMSREEAEELVALIPTISVEPFHTGRLQELSEHYRSIIGTHSTTDLVEIIKSVYSKKREAEAAGRRVSQMDDRYMKLAEELLHGELSVALEIPKEEVREYIRKGGKVAESAEEPHHKEKAPPSGFPDRGIFVWCRLCDGKECIQGIQITVAGIKDVIDCFLPKGHPQPVAGVHSGKQHIPFRVIGSQAQCTARSGVLLLFKELQFTFAVRQCLYRLFGSLGG